MTEMAGFGNTIALAFAMSDRVWERHANPWSVWTRVASAPLPFVAIGSHAWLGWPLALILFAAVACWLWFNPRVFPPPISTNNWSSKAVLGERVWLNRSRFPIPGDHATAATLLGIVSGVGALTGLVGGLLTDAWMLVLGVAIMVLGKLWFCDRMVWLYEDMKDTNPTYRSWLR
jgi:hypothetical protein